MNKTTAMTHDLSYKKYWQDLSSTSHLHPANVMRYKLIKKEVVGLNLSIDEGRSILDCGCGDGSLLLYLSTLLPKAKFSGIDISEERIQQNKLNLIDFSFFSFDLGALNKAILDHNYDLVITSELIEHVIDDVTFLRNLYDYCSAGGTLVLTTQAGPMFKMDKIVLGHLRHYTLTDLINKIEAAGFIIKKAKRTGFPWLSLQKRVVDLFFNSVQKKLGKDKKLGRTARLILTAMSSLYMFCLPGLGPQIIVVAQKP